MRFMYGFIYRGYVAFRAWDLGGTWSSGAEGLGFAVSDR